MPVKDGLEATKRIKALDKDKQTVIIAITASVFEEEKENIMSAGCDDFLRKPFLKEDLLGLMERHLSVRFVFEEQVSNHITNGAGNGSLNPVRLARLPLDLLNDLEQSAVRAEMDRISSLISQIRGHDATTANALTVLANDFMYDKIVDLIQEARELR